MEILTTEAKLKLNTVENKEAFFKTHPNNEHEAPFNPSPVVYTDSEWVDEVVKRFIIAAIKEGRQALIRESLTQVEVDY